MIKNLIKDIPKPLIKSLIVSDRITYWNSVMAPDYWDDVMNEHEDLWNTPMSDEVK